MHLTGPWGNNATGLSQMGYQFLLPIELIQFNFILMMHLVVLFLKKTMFKTFY